MTPVEIALVLLAASAAFTISASADLGGSATRAAVFADAALLGPESFAVSRRRAHR